MSSKKYLPGPERYKELRETGHRGVGMVLVTTWYSIDKKYWCIWLSFAMAICGIVPQFTLAKPGLKINFSAWSPLGPVSLNS